MKVTALLAAVVAGVIAVLLSQVYVIRLADCC